jgi:SAM-dependent methyltransferase
MDLSPEAIARARADAARAGRDNVEFVVVDLCDFDRTAEPESFDFITTFDAIHDQGEAAQRAQGDSACALARIIHE